MRPMSRTAVSRAKLNVPVSVSGRETGPQQDDGQGMAGLC